MQQYTGPQIRNDCKGKQMPRGVRFPKKVIIHVTSYYVGNWHLLAAIRLRQ